WVFTVTAYAPVTNDGNVNLTLPVPTTVRLSPPLSCNTNPAPVNPLMVPPIGKPVEQVTVTLVTLAVAVPAPLVTWQVCVGLLGCVRTVTLYVPGTRVGKVNCCVPVPLTGRLSRPLFCNINPEPVKPLTVPAMENFDEQLILTLVTLAVANPEPLVMLQICVGLVGCVSTVTLYEPPKVNAVWNVNWTVPVPVTVKLSPPLFCNANPAPLRPVTVPPIVTVAAAQVTVTEVTFAVAVPVPPATVQVCDGLLGCVATATAYAPFFATAVLKVKLTVPVPGLIVRLSAPLLVRPRPVPVKPVTVPPIVYVPDVGGVVLPPPPLLPPGIPLHEARISGVRVKQARANIFLA